jgi:transposase
MLFGGKIAGHQPRQGEEDEAMSKKLKVAGPATNDEIGAAYQASRVPHERERLLAIRMGQQGEWTFEKIAIVRWVRAYRQGGIPRLLERRYEGRREKLSEDDKQALVDGLRRGQWKTAKEIRSWLQRERGIELKLGGVYYWLKQLEARWKVPRKSHKKKTRPKKRRLNARLSPS